MNNTNQNYQPVFKKQIPPTNREKLNANNLDTSNLASQFSIKVWKSSGWREFAYYFPITIGVLLLLIGLAVQGEKRDAEYAPLFYFLGVAFLFLIIPLKYFGKCIYTMGFDWKLNSLWIKKSHKGITAIEPDANTIEYFNFMNNASTRSNPYWMRNPSQPRYYIKKSQILMVKRTASEHLFPIAGSEIATASEAKKIIKRANKLLEEQK